MLVSENLKAGEGCKKTVKRIEVGFSTGREMGDSKYKMRIYADKGRNDVPFLNLIKRAVENFYYGLFYQGFNNDPIQIDASKAEVIRNIRVTLYARNPYNGHCDFYHLVLCLDPVDEHSDKVMFCYRRR
ncbi:MAG: hypothetical protein WC473_05485 [Patescibacteria group bacterium]|jgi:hypothetical protein